MPFKPFNPESVSSGGGAEQKLGSGFDRVSREILLGLLDDLDEGKIDKKIFDAATTAINEARAAGNREDALRILAGAAIDESISDERYQRMKAALEAPESARTIHPDTELKSLVGEGGERPVERGPETPEIDPEQAEAVAREAVDMLTGTPEAARAVVDGFVPLGTPPIEKEKAAEEIASKESKWKMYLRVLDHVKSLKNWQIKEFVVSAGAGGAARMTIRLAFGSSLGVGIAASALGGGITRGVREYRKESRQFTAESVINKLKGAKDQTEKAAILARAKDAYDKARISGSKEELEMLADELRATKALSAVAESGEGLENLNDRDKILAILKIADGARKEVPKTNNRRKEAEALIKEINFERKKVDMKKVAWAVVKGAAAGVIGGKIASALADHLSPFVHDLFAKGSLPEVVAPKLAMPHPAVAPSAAEAFHQDVLMQKAVAAGAATMGVLENARTEILERKFGAVVEKGEGATHVARKIIHDYLVNQKLLNPDSFEDPSLEQLVYMEDTLKPIVSEAAKKGFQVGDQFELTGENVAKAFEKASKLMPKQIDHLKELLQEASHRISSKNIEMMTNLDDVRDVGNQFSDEVIRKAQEAAAKAAAEIHEAVLAPQAEAVIQEVVPPSQIPMAEAAQKVVKETAKAGAKSSAPKILELVALLGGAAAAGGGLGWGALEIKERRAASKSKKEAAKQAGGAEGTGHNEAAVSDWESEGGAVPGEAGEERPIRRERPESGAEEGGNIPQTTEPPPGLPFVKEVGAEKKTDATKSPETKSEEGILAQNLSALSVGFEIDYRSRKFAGVQKYADGIMRAIEQHSEYDQELSEKMGTNKFLARKNIRDPYQFLASIRKAEEEALQENKGDKQVQETIRELYRRVDMPGLDIENPKSIQEQFNKLTDPYKDKKIIISTSDEKGDFSIKSTVIRMFPAIEKMIEEIGVDKLSGLAINFFKPKYGESGRMFVVDSKKIEVKKGKKVVGARFVRVLNVNIDSSAESISKFIEDNLSKKGT